MLHVDQGKNACGGSIINPRVVVTAAHCCESAIKLEEVIAGELEPLETQNFGQRRKIQSHLSHPDFNADTLENDICLVYLDEDLTLAGDVASIPLNRNALTDTGVKGCVVSGWGRTSVS